MTVPLTSAPPTGAVTEPVGWVTSTLPTSLSAPVAVQLAKIGRDAPDEVPVAGRVGAGERGDRRRAARAAGVGPERARRVQALDAIRDGARSGSARRGPAQRRGGAGHRDGRAHPGRRGPAAAAWALPEPPPVQNASTATESRGAREHGGREHQDASDRGAHGGVSSGNGKTGDPGDASRSRVPRALGSIQGLAV